MKTLSPVQIETYCSLSLAMWWTWVWLTDCMAASSQCKAQWMRIPRWPHFCSMPQDSYVGCVPYALLWLEGKTCMLEHLLSLPIFEFHCCALLTQLIPSLSLVIGFLHWDMGCIFHRVGYIFLPKSAFSLVSWTWLSKDVNHPLPLLLRSRGVECFSGSQLVCDKSYTKPDQAISPEQHSSPARNLAAFTSF